MLSREMLGEEIGADVSWMPITGEVIAKVVVSLRSGEIAAGCNPEGRIRTEVALAAIVRLQAAVILKLGDSLDEFDDAVLAAAIAAAPLHEITGYYYFDPDELLAHAVAYEAMRRIEIGVRAREASWRRVRGVQSGSEPLSEFSLPSQ